MIKLWNSCEQQHIALIQAMHEFIPTGILHLNANLHRFQTFFPPKNLPLNIPLEKQNMEWNDNNSYTKRAMWVLCRGASPHMGANQQWNSDHTTARDTEHGQRPARRRVTFLFPSLTSILAGSSKQRRDSLHCHTPHAG